MGLSAVPRVFPSLPPHDSLFSVGERGEEPGQHMTLRFRGSQQTMMQKHINRTTNGNALQHDKKSGSMPKRAFDFQTQQNRTMSEAENQRKTQQAVSDFLRHPPVCSSQLVSSRQAFWPHPTPSSRLKALHICRLVW